MRGWIAWAAALLGTLAAICACQQLVGIGGGPPTTLECGPAWSLYTGACGACVATECCEEGTACAANSVCSPYAACLGACNGDPACRSACTVNNPVGASPEVSALSACIATSCQAPCGLACGGFSAYVSEPDAAAACERCLEGTAECQPTQACASSADCDAYLRCVAACQGAGDCVTQCTYTHDAGAASYKEFQTAYSGTCRNACAFGNYWACVGHVSWPTPEPGVTVDSASFGITAVIGNTIPIPHAHVAACLPNDLACTTPLVAMDADDAGIVQLSIPLAQDSSGLGPNGFLQITPPRADGGLPEIVTSNHWNFPLSAAHWDNTAPLRPTPAATNANAASLLSYFKITEEPGRGYAGAYVTDCLSNSAPDVTIAMSIPPDAGALEFSTYTALAGQVTGADGAVGVLNVPAGSLEFTAYPAPLGGRASSHVTVYVAPGGFSPGGLPPTP